MVVIFLDMSLLINYFKKEGGVVRQKERWRKKEEEEDKKDGVERRERKCENSRV